EVPEYPRNVEKAKQLLREAGYPNGFDVDWVTPLPTFYSRGERLIAQLRDLVCVKDLDGKFDQYEKSINPAERKKLAEEIQHAILDNYYLVPVFRHAFVNAIGPRVALQKWQDVFPTITTGYAYPWEDLKVKDQ